MTENAHVRVIAHPELTGVALRVVGDRVYVAYDHASLDDLSTAQWANNAEEWYDANELVELRERAEDESDDRNYISSCFE